MALRLLVLGIFYYSTFTRKISNESKILIRKEDSNNPTSAGKVNNIKKLTKTLLRD
jgi:hypothetical protein